MKPVAQGAFNRRLALKAGMASLLMAATGRSSAARSRRNERLLMLFSVMGGRLITKTNAAGYPLPTGYGDYQPLVSPIAIAASFNDVYIADAGVGRLYRYDRGFDAMAVLPDRGVSPGIRLQTGPDGSLYVLDPYLSEIRRYGRNGQSLPTLKPRLPTSRYTEFAVHPLTGRCYAVDFANRCVDQIEPLGQLAIEFLSLDEAGPIVADERGLLIAGGQCRCVTEWLQTRRGRTLAGKTLRLPKALTMLDRQLIALDAFDNQIVLVNDEGGERLVPGSLDLLNPSALATDQGTLYIADSGARKVVGYSLRRPA